MPDTAGQIALANSVCWRRYCTANPMALLHAADQIGAPWTNLQTIMLSLRAHHDELVHELD